jgi:hypothetical protein
VDRTVSADAAVGAAPAAAVAVAAEAVAVAAVFASHANFRAALATPAYASSRLEPERNHQAPENAAERFQSLVLLPAPGLDPDVDPEVDPNLDFDPDRDSNRDSGPDLAPATSEAGVATARCLQLTGR